MNTPFLKLASLCPPLLAMVATPVQAGFDPAIVPAEAQWVLYADFDTLRASTLGTELMTMLPAIDVDSEEFPVKVSIPKIIEAIGSGTAYGTNFSENPKEIDGALVFRGTEDLRKIVQAFLIAGSADESGSSEIEIKEIKDLGLEAYQVGDGIVALPPGNTILASKSQASLAAARALLASDKGSLARAKDSTLSRLIPKSPEPYLLVASMVPHGNGLFDGNGPEARILQMASAASIAVGEDGTMTTARIQIEATSADMADKLAKILQGAVAMLSFAETDDQALAAFLRSVNVERTPSGALLNLAYPTDRLVQMLKTLHEDQTRETRKSANAGERAPSKSAPVEGRVLAEWKADKDLANKGPSADNIVTLKVENVALFPGAMIWLNGNRNQGENGRFDYVEIAPATGGGAPVRFEAENMRLNNYRIEGAPFASNGELIMLQGGSGSARLTFPGTAGTYTLTVAYVDENDGQSALSVSLSDPKPQPGPEAPSKP